jgi:hypothetical protein
MSATRYRDGCLSIFLLAGLLALAPRSDAARAAVTASHSGGHVGGFGGGRHLGMHVPRGGEFGGGFVSRRSGDQRFAHGRNRRRGFFPYFGYPYYDEADLDYGYDQYYSNHPYPSGYPHGGHCDVTSHSYPQDCVWKDGL